jgi:hypothetical protein
LLETFTPSFADIERHLTFALDDPDELEQDEVWMEGLGARTSQKRMADVLDGLVAGTVFVDVECKAHLTTEVCT